MFLDQNDSSRDTTEKAFCKTNASVMLPPSEHVLFNFFLYLSCTVFDWLEHILQFCVRLEAIVFFPAVAFEISPFADYRDSKTRNHLQDMAPAGESVAVDTQVVRGHTYQTHLLVRGHAANNAPRIMHKPLSSQGTPHSRSGSIAFQDTSSVTWLAGEGLNGIDVENTPWQDYDIPDELMQVLANTPRKVLDIVRESIDNRRALKASISAETSNLASNTTTPDANPVRTADNSAAESPTTPVSQHAISEVSASTVGSTSSSRSSSPNQAIESTTTLTSSPDNDSKKPHHLDVLLQALGSRDTMQRESLRTEQSKLPKSRPKVFKDHGLARLFRSRNTTKSDVAPPEAADNESTSFSECASCFEDIPNSKCASLACQHKYCSSCFVQLVRTAMQNENFFPPKCCLQEIPRTMIRTHLAIRDFAEFDEKAQEYAVPTGSRWYCSAPRCGKWIETRERVTSATLVCPHCRCSMCTSCRGPKHSLTEDCPEDRGLGATLEEAEREGWRRCYNCRSMVELATGCRHITCKCKAEFWYVNATSSYGGSAKFC